jgi:hypothetical protein
MAKRLRGPEESTVATDSSRLRGGKISRRHISRDSNIQLIFFTQVISHVLLHVFLDFFLKLVIIYNIFGHFAPGHRGVTGYVIGRK